VLSGIDGHQMEYVLHGWIGGQAGFQIAASQFSKKKDVFSETKTGLRRGHP